MAITSTSPPVTPVHDCTTHNSPKISSSHPIHSDEITAYTQPKENRLHDGFHKIGSVTHESLPEPDEETVALEDSSPLEEPDGLPW